MQVMFKVFTLLAVAAPCRLQNCSSVTEKNPWLATLSINKEMLINLNRHGADSD